MNDLSRKIFIKLFAPIGSTAAALSVLFFAGIKSTALAILLACLAGAAGNLVFTWLGAWLMRMQKQWSTGKPGDCVFAFGQLPEQEAPSAGGKGKVLARLFQAGFPVPDGCVVLSSAFDGDELTAEAWEKVKRQLARLRKGKDIAFAVRSSALSEDSAQASFAGEFESVLGSKTDEEVRAALQTVRRSGHAGRVQSYGQAKGLGEREHAVAVVIQKQVNADYAGVLFTADPLTGDRMTMTGNFVRGLGDKLVSGQVSASTFTFDRPAGVYHGPAELQPIAKGLHRATHEVENTLGDPQDIEWAVQGKKIYILQARPITTLNGYDPSNAVWNGSLRGNFLWSATNLMEASPEVQTPFTASLRPYLDTIGGPAVTIKNVPLNGIICGRFYVNISVQVTAFARMFKGDKLRTYQEMSGWWGELPADMDIPLLPLTGVEWMQEVLPALLRTLGQMSKYRKLTPAFLAENPRNCAELRAQVQRSASKSELLALWKTISISYRDAIYHIISASSDAQLRLERELRGLVGDEDANALLSNLGGLSSRLESLGPMAGLGLVARGELSREEYLQRYGHRGVNEGECAWSRPIEDPRWLDRQLAEWQKSPVDIDTLLARQQAAYRTAWARFCQKYPGKVKSMQKRILQAAQGAAQRELVRSEATRGGLVLRAFALRAGELLGVGEDVFFLTIDEVLAGLAGEPVNCQLIPARKETHQRYCALPPYPALIRGRFDPFAWAADPNHHRDLYDAQAQVAATAEKGDRVITGAPGALGVVEGIVRRLDRVEDSGQLQAGEVLVTTMTNIGWTPLFPRAAAIVTDLGAPLSHAAIVARELGIPAVVGCGDATTRLKTGDRVRVDGGRGMVEILAD